MPLIICLATDCSSSALHYAFTDYAFALEITVKFCTFLYAVGYHERGPSLCKKWSSQGKIK
jgi:hypothetical protein